MQKDAFKPQGRELGVIDVGNPLSGPGAAPRRVAPQAPSMGRMPQQQQAPAPLPMDPATRGAAISSERTVPRGAQQVQLAGPQPTLAPATFERGGQSFQPSAPANILPSQEQVAPQQAPPPAMGQPQPFLRRPQFQQQRSVTTFRVTMRGVGPDGAEYASVYDAEFPPGTQPLDLDFAQIS